MQAAGLADVAWLTGRWVGEFMGGRGEEVFAPVTALLRVGSTEEAARLANDVRQGLVAAIFTNDLDKAMTLAGRLEAGLVRVNASTAGVDYHVPFGGRKGSSYGPREQGTYAREFYTAVKTTGTRSGCIGMALSSSASFSFSTAPMASSAGSNVEFVQ